MALSVLLGLSPSPLGQLMIWDAAKWRMSGFRFDSAPEPETHAPFIAESQITSSDLVIDLRAEAPTPFTAQACHVPPDALAQLPLPPNTSRIVLACRTGLRAYHAATALRPRWPGEIALLALPGA